MDTTMALGSGRETAYLSAGEIAVSEPVGLGRGRVLALIALCALSALGWGYALTQTLAEGQAGSAPSPTEGLLRQAEDPSMVGVAIVTLLILAVSAAAAAVALHRHRDPAPRLPRR